MSDRANRTDETHDVIESLYDLPFGGHWVEVQKSLCGFWANPSASTDQAQIALLERHFERALALLDRVPEQDTRWRTELYRIPLPAAVFNRQGELLDVNEAGSSQLTQLFQPGAFGKVNQGILRKTFLQLGEDEIVNAELQQERGAGDQARPTLMLRQIQLRSKTRTQLYMGILVTNDVPSFGLDAMAQTYKLTGAETRLCLQLASGMSLDNVAAQSEVKKTTLRTQLAGCFSKLNVNSQPELVAIVLHNMFAGAQLAQSDTQAPTLTRYLDPEIHGTPPFSVITLADKRKLGYFEYGDPDGVPAFYLHGSLDGALFMKSQTLTGTNIRLLAVERPGIGESTPTRDFSPAAYARDIMQLADQLKLDHYIVIGRSMGSWDAVTVAQQDPERAKLLVLVGGRLPVIAMADHADHEPLFRSLYNGIWKSDTMGKLMLRIMIVQLMVRGPKQFLFDANLPRIERELNNNPIYLRHMRALWLRCTTFGVDATHELLKLYRDPAPNPPWQDLATPLLLIHGELDTNVPIDRLLDQTKSFPDREVVKFKGLGHRLIAVAMGKVLSTISAHWHQKFNAEQKVS